jgi:hypothetical protein
VFQAALDEVLLQAGFQGAGEHDDAVLAPLAVANGDVVPRHVEVVDAHLAALLPPQAGATEAAGLSGANDAITC